MSNAGQLHRRTLQRLVLSGAATLAAGSRARAAEQSRILVNFPPGGLLDGTARLLADRAQREDWGTVVVENRAGAAGLIGAAAAAQSRPDGRTVLLSLETPFTVTPHILRDGQDPIRDLVPIALVLSFPLVLLVHPSLAATGLAEFAAAARRQTIFYTSAGIGSPGHLAMEYLRQRLGLPGVALEHVAQRGNTEALTALLAGTVQAGFLAIGGGPDLIREGRLRPLAVSGAQRYPALPDVPSVAEQGLLGFDVRIAALLLARRGVPEAEQQRWRDLVRHTLAEEVTGRRFHDWGVQPEDGSAESAGQWLGLARARWGEVVRIADIRA